MVELLILALLIGSLSDDSIETRGRAAAELYRRGEAVRHVLLQARPSLADAEVGGRIDDVLGRLEVDRRAREFGGGNRVCGLAASLRSDRWYGSGPFRLELEILNVGPENRALSRISGWDTEYPDCETRSSDAEARLIVRRFIGPPGLRRLSRQASRLPVEKAVVALRPGESTRLEAVLEGKDLPAGDYLVTVELYPAALPPGAPENLRTNSVRISRR